MKAAVNMVRQSVLDVLSRMKWVAKSNKYVIYCEADSLMLDNVTLDKVQLSRVECQQSCAMDTPTNK